jgi:hypothetical protein
MTDYIPVIRARPFVIPARPFVIPAEAGIQWGLSAALALDPRFRGGDGVVRMERSKAT